MVRRRLSGERGAASVELAVTFPVVLLLVMTLIQAALWFHARSIALGAAQEGAREGRVQPASIVRAESAAAGFLEQTASDLLTDRTVTVADSPTSIEVTVTGTSLSLFPGLSGWSVTQSAIGPVERVTS
ncbi:TadE/TadG family type IV pilus assembly protein [Blastococcus aggregatus]|uniref:TadE/TadG family type IV pilus assembly protein n=1 Tax=Blastococcus aggregatus TaxID=38502 RepID=UPI001FE7C4F8|nr:TadE family protein [Blastococcus aggregatus]